MPLVCCVVADGPAPPGVLDAIARACSPRVEPHGDAAVVFDADGLTRVLGSAAHIGADVRRLAAAHGMSVRVALAGASTTAWLLAHAKPGLTVVSPGEDAAVLAGLPISVLAALPDLAEAAGPARRRRARGPRNFRAAPGPHEASASPQARVALAGLLATLDRWGLRTLGDVARLQRADLHARFGATGVRLHQAACGEDAAPLVPAGETRTFVERIDLEWPIEGLEPLSFILARLCDALCGALERADRGAIAVTTRLHLVTRESHARGLHLPAPMRDAKVLRTLILLDLESHPPQAGIDAVSVTLEVAPGRIVQGSLLTRALPSPETTATLVARLGALMGESRVGAPALVDTHDDRAAAMQVFSASEAGRTSAAMPFDPAPAPRRPSSSCQFPSGRLHLRRFRLPLVVRVAVERGRPVAVRSHARGFAGGRVLVAAGPWRSSGRWWTLDRRGWDRDEWEVALADGRLYRLAHDRLAGHWEVEGAID